MMSIVSWAIEQRRHLESQTAELQMRVALMNHFSALGTAEIVRVG